MKYAVLALVTLLTTLVHSQEIQPDSIKKNGLQLGITFSPEMCFRYISSDANNHWLVEIQDSMEVPKYGYTLGFNGIIPLSKRGSLATGILFNNSGERTKKEVQISPVNYVNHYYFIQVPLKYNYVLISKKIDVYASLGVLGNFSIGSRMDVNLVDRKDPISYYNVVNLNKFSMGAIGGLGISAPLAKSWDFKAEINYKQSITPISSGSIHKMVYAVGTNFGLYYQF
jgi:hypothetical protein